MQKDEIPSEQEVRNFATQFRFSEREIQVFMSLIDKVTTAEAIGQRLGVSPNTISNHFKNILRKTGTTNKSSLLSMFLIHIIKQLRHCKMFERRPRVLVLDDEPDICEILHEDLTARGVVVHSFTDPLKALDATKELRLDFIVSDIRMPQLDGVNFLSGVRDIHRYHPMLLFMTGFAQFKKDELMHMGAVECFEKPLDPEKVFLTIMQYFIETPVEPARYVRTPSQGLGELEADTVAPENVGFGGAFIPVAPDKLVKEKRFEQGAVFDFKLDITAGEPPMKVRGEVVWRRLDKDNGRAPGVGVRFLSLGQKERTRIDSFVRDKKIRSFIPIGQMQYSPA